MELDKELLDAFESEIDAILVELKPIVQQLRQNTTEASLYSKFGQVIDRIYGTAATMGFKEIAEYCRAMKAVTYQASQVQNLSAMGQVKDLILVAMPLLDKMKAAIHKPTEIKKIQYTMQKERQKAEDMTKRLFGHIKRTSVA